MKRIAIITGAGRGIGYELCKQFLQNGYHTIGISRNIDQLIKLENIDALSHDLTQGESIDLIYEKVSKLNEVNEVILIHNAGVLINKPFESIEDSDVDLLFKINYLSPLKITRRLMPWLKTVSRAHCIFMGSMGGFQGSSKYPGLSVYSSVKSAVSTLGECLAEEYKASGVTFNTLALGAVDTEMLQNAFPGFHPDVSAERMSQWIFQFSTCSMGLINGKVIPVAGSNP
jgi:NAD(P)-dependent dehydrogenase (short-subunit alcohol dehydrogenase family)